MRSLHPLSLALTALAGTSFLPAVLGWGAAGHEIVATIAQIYTDPAVLARLCSILTTNNLDAEATESSPHWPCHLATISTWADKYKYRMFWSAPLHYINAVGDHPSDTCKFPGDGGWSGKPNINLLGGIYNTSHILMDYADGELGNIYLAQEALKFIVHFIGDLHMPLHLTGRDKGGNQVDVCWDGRRTNLHSAWDGYIPAKAIRNVSYNYSRPLPFERVETNLRGAIYDPYIRRIIWEGIEDKWAGDLLDWVSCPSTDTHVFQRTVWRTILDALLPTWIMQSGDTSIADTERICPYHWAKPIHALNCELIWPKALQEDQQHSLSRLTTKPRRPRCRRHRGLVEDLIDGDDAIDDEDAIDAEDTQGEPPYELDNPEYMNPIEERMLLEQFLAQGGIRLAAILNYIFGATPEVSPLL